jgi:hypothetical protein
MTKTSKGKLISSGLVSATLAFVLAGGAALVQTPAFAEDPDLLTPKERALGRRPDLNPEWTWMTEGQAIQILKGNGYSDVLSLEKYGEFWRGKALKENASYHVAINRYSEVVDHMDNKSLLIAEERSEKAVKASKTMLATVNGSVVAFSSRMAPSELTVARPVPTVMGEVGWTWITEDQAVQILKGKGFTNIGTLRRDAQGIWRAKAIKDDLALRVAVDVFSNVETQPESHGGLAQASPSD